MPFFLYVVAGMMFYRGLCLVFKRYYGKPSKPVTVCLVAVAVGFVIFLLEARSLVGVKKPGAVFEHPNYKGVFLVRLYPDGQDVKSYLVPGYVHSKLESEEDYDGNVGSWREYRLEYAIMPNGNKITFSGYDDPITHVGSRHRMLDDQNGEWNVEITDKQPPRKREG